VAVDVDDVGDGVEGEERDADRSRTLGTLKVPAPRAASAAFTLSAAKLAYLKTPRTTRLAVTAKARSRSDRGVPLARLIRIATQ
jgi:hypothetical protein